MRRLIFQIAACMCLGAYALVRGVERAFERTINFILSAFPASPPALALAGDFEPVSSFRTFADPHVERHEAGASRRAAARGI
jgi:hypothetical protein